MKYISLTGLMAMYGSYIKEHRAVVNLSSNVTAQALEKNKDYTPFTIQPEQEADTGQMLNTLIPRGRVVDYGTFDPVTLLPILEVEWLKQEMELNEETAAILEQTSYMALTWIMWWIKPNEEDEWVSYLESEENVIVEVEDLDDTALILSTFQFPEVSMPKIRSWSVLITYGAGFPKLFRRCTDQSSILKEFQYHIPFLLALFMRDYCTNNLETWSKQVRLTMENEIQGQMNNLAHYYVNAGVHYTYGLSTGISRSDTDFIRNILTMIHERLHELNTDIGLISFSEYKHIKGPEVIKASVRLSSMDINWRKEIERVKREKEEAAMANDDLSNGH